MHVRDVRQLFFIDETGCNRHTLLRAYGYSPRGAPVSRAAGVDSAARGDNHSVIIAIGAGAAASWRTARWLAAVAVRDAPTFVSSCEAASRPQCSLLPRALRCRAPRRST